jgi:hypothetical protein
VAKKPTSIDGYLGSVGPDKRVALEKLRRTIHNIVPGVEECISYGMPAFRLDGKVVAGFQTTAKSCSYYPFGGTTLGDPRQGPRGLRASEVRASFRTGEAAAGCTREEAAQRPHGRGQSAWPLKT